MSYVSREIHTRQCFSTVLLISVVIVAAVMNATSVHSLQRTTLFPARDLTPCVSSQSPPPETSSGRLCQPTRPPSFISQEPDPTHWVSYRYSIYRRLRNSQKRVYIRICDRIRIFDNWTYIQLWFPNTTPDLDPATKQHAIQGVTATSFGLQYILPPCWRYTMLPQCNAVNVYVREQNVARE